MKLFHSQLAAALLLAAATSAHAQWAVYDFRVEQGIKAVVDAIRGAGQAQTATQAAAAEQMSGAMAEIQKMEAQRANDRAYQVPDACGVIAATQGFADAQRIANPAAHQTARGRPASSSRYKAPSGSHKDSTRLLMIAQGDVPPPSPEAQARLSVSVACENFAEPGSVRGMACKDAGTNPSNSLGLEANADRQATTLFWGAAEKGRPVRKVMTFIPDGSEDKKYFAIDFYRKNLNTPLDLRKLEKTEIDSMPGRQYMTLQDAYEARMSMADHPIHAWLTNRTENIATIKPVEQMLNSPVMASYVKAYLDSNGLSARWKTKGISLDELTNLEVERRHANIDWYANIMSQPGSPVEKELAAIQAFHSTLLWRQAQKLDEISILLGQILAASVRTEMTPQLNALHAAATRSNR